MSFLSEKEKENIEYQIDDYNKWLEGHELALKGEVHIANLLIPKEIENIKSRLAQLNHKLKEHQNICNLNCVFTQLTDNIINIYKTIP